MTPEQKYWFDFVRDAYQVGYEAYVKVARENRPAREQEQALVDYIESRSDEVERVGCPLELTRQKPYTGTHNAGYTECQEFFGAITLDSDEPLGRQIVTMLDVAIRGVGNQWVSWTELLRTVCEHLNWVTPAGRYKLTACAQALRALQGQGLVKVPAKQDLAWIKAKPKASARTDPGEELTGTARDWEPVAVLPVSEPERGLWNEYIHRYHPLGYQRAFGAHQRYFIRTRGERLAGCLLFASSAWALAARDEWIGWTRQDRVDASGSGATAELGGREHAVPPVSLSAGEKLPGLAQ